MKPYSGLVTAGFSLWGEVWQERGRSSIAGMLSGSGASSRELFSSVAAFVSRRSCVAFVQKIAHQE
jgi:hypothetical protein